MSFRIARIRNNILVGRCQVVQPAKPICPGPCCHLTYRRCHCWRIVLLFIKPTHGCAYILFILYATLNNWYIISYIMFWGKQVIKRKNIYQTFVLFYQDPKIFYTGAASDIYHVCLQSLTAFLSRQLPSLILICESLVICSIKFKTCIIPI